MKALPFFFVYQLSYLIAIVYTQSLSSKRHTHIRVLNWESDLSGSCFFFEAKRHCCAARGLKSFDKNSLLKNPLLYVWLLLYTIRKDIGTRYFPGDDFEIYYFVTGHADYVPTDHTALVL